MFFNALSSSKATYVLSSVWLSTHSGLDEPQKRNLGIIEEFKGDARNDDNDISNKNYELQKQLFKNQFYITKNPTVSQKIEKLMAYTN